MLQFKSNKIVNQVLPLFVMLLAEDFASITLQLVQNLKGWLNSTLWCFCASKCQVFHSSCDHNQGWVYLFLTIRTTDQKTQQFTKNACTYLCVNYKKATMGHILKSWWWNFSFHFMKNQILSSDEFIVMAEGEKLAPTDLL